MAVVSAPRDGPRRAVGGLKGLTYPTQREPSGAALQARLPSLVAL